MVTPILKSSLQIKTTELLLDKVLATGQVFRWRKSNDTWYGVIRNKVWALRQDTKAIQYDVLHEFHTSPNNQRFPSHEAELKDYFNLEFALHDMKASWNLENDSHLRNLVVEHAGLRVIRQDPLECLISFITSSCNNIPRISSLLLKLSELSEEKWSFCEMSFSPLPPLSFFLTEHAESTLRHIGFGYRAKYIVKAVESISEKGGIEWLHSLRKVDLGEAKEELESLSGVGPKVASCVCLMSLDKHSAVPIDTHIYQVAVRHYGVASGSLTNKRHSELEETFQELHGPFAGWAQAYLFYSNLKKESSRSKKRRLK